MSELLAYVPRPLIDAHHERRRHSIVVQPGTGVLRLRLAATGYLESWLSKTGLVDLFLAPTRPFRPPWPADSPFAAIFEDGEVDRSDPSDEEEKEKSSEESSALVDIVRLDRPRQHRLRRAVTDTTAFSADGFLEITLYNLSKPLIAVLSTRLTTDPQILALVIIGLGDTTLVDQARAFLGDDVLEELRRRVPFDMHVTTRLQGTLARHDTSYGCDFLIW